MADEEETTQEESPEQQGKKGKFNLKTIVIIGGTVLVQALVVLVVAWIVRGVSTGAPAPQQAAAAEVEQNAEKMAILSVTPSDPDAKITAINGQDGDLKYWSIRVCVRVPEQGADALQTLLKDNEPLIRQEIQTVIRASDAVILKREADYATLKRQIRNALNKVLGKGATIEEVVIPECIPSSMDG